MTDPSIGMQSFQEALLNGEIRPKRGELDRNLYILRDNANGEDRLTYVRLEGKTVTAFVNFGACDPIDDTPCFGIGYAVPEQYRNQGRAKEVVRAAIAEMQHGFKRAGLSVFYIEAIVEADNKASQRVAEQAISGEPVAVKEKLSGLPAFQYVRKLIHP